MPKEKIVLLIVDIQKALVDQHPYQLKTFLYKIGQLTAFCREKQIEIIYARHDGGKGDVLERGTPGWEIYAEAAPRSGEKVLDKRYNSALRETGLCEYLDAVGVTTIILAGMQTEYCIDATCKAAFEHGYHVIIPRGATTTFDAPPFSAKEVCAYHETHIWPGRFATVTDLPQLFAELNDVEAR